jgi:hypothetical protein
MNLVRTNAVFSAIRSLKTALSATQINHYATRPRNILRNRYNYRNKDGTFKEYNEAITILPKEFEQQGKKSLV